MTKYNNLITGLFCIVPLFIVLTARYLKNKLSDYRNYKAILCVSILLSLSFSSIVMYGVIVQFEYVGGKKFDLAGFFAVLLTLTISVTGNLTRYRKFGSRIAINNRYTRYSISVWKTVHYNMSTIQSFVFLLLAVIISFMQGWITYIILASGLIMFLSASYLYSYFIMTLFARKHDAIAIKES